MDGHLNTFLIGSWNELHEYSSAAYHGLKKFLSSMSSGPYSLLEIYDRDGDGSVLVAIVANKTRTEFSIIATKDGSDYTFSM